MGLWKSPLDNKYRSLRNHMVGRIKQSQVSQDLLPPQGFGPDGQNPRTHSRGPRLLGTKISLQQKKSRFFKNREKDCRKVRTQRIAETLLGVEETLEGVWNGSLCHEILK